VDADTSRDEEELRGRLAQARDRLDGLVGHLRALDRELEGLAAERTQYRLLHEVCSALEELRTLGAAGLFWGGRAADAEADDHLRRVRGRVDVFQKRLSEVEDRRQEIFDDIQRTQEETDLLEEDLLEAQVQEERRKQEWIIEREIGVLPARQLVMAWTRGDEEDQRFRNSLATSLLISLLLAVLVPRIDLPLPELGEEPIEVPERLARLIMEARPLPSPPPARETKPEQQVPEESLAAETPPPQTTKPKEGPGKGPGEGPGAGPGKGILAFREKFSGFTENQAVARLGSQARISSPGAAPSGPVERSMVTTLAPGSSGGINLAAVSRGVVSGGGGGGGKIAGVQIARATSTIGGGGGGGRAVGSGSGGGPPLGRTDEEIQIVFDRHKAGLYRLYNGELRRDPTLKGQMILRLRIEPDGSVSLCELHATDMRAPQLAAEVVARVRTFDFGAKEGITAVTIVYPIDFLPAT
jgi:hypothetical protein